MRATRQRLKPKREAKKGPRRMAKGPPKMPTRQQATGAAASPDRSRSGALGGVTLDDKSDREPDVLVIL